MSFSTVLQTLYALPTVALALIVATAVGLRWFAHLKPAQRRDVIRLIRALRQGS